MPWLTPLRASMVPKSFFMLFCIERCYSQGVQDTMSLKGVEIQPENQTASMDKCHLSSAPMPELQ